MSSEGKQWGGECMVGAEGGRISLFPTLLDIYPGDKSDRGYKESRIRLIF